MKSPHPSRSTRCRLMPIPLLAATSLILTACESTLMRQTDRDVAALIRDRQQAALNYEAPADVGSPDERSLPTRAAYEHNPRPTSTGIPPGFEPPTSQPATAPASRPGSQPASQPARGRERIFTLTDALAYAQRHRRLYQSAKEELYSAALNLTLERHFWTPIFAAELKTIYGNYGEAKDFDQAMRFVADLSVSQRLPYGGEFTAAMISTLIRDVGKTITASEGSSASLGLRVPLLRDAGHVAQEDLIRLERELTYAVRIFERFRRQQLVTVARAYFDLLAAKQAVIDSQASLERAIDDYDRARAKEALGLVLPLDTQRAEQQMLGSENNLESAREQFRFQADQFKLEIGMPVDEPLGLDDLEDIATIERKAESGTYPLLAPPEAVALEDLAIAVALERRFDLLTTRDRIDDARRGVAISRNALLPDLDWTGTVTFDTKPEHYNAGAFHFERANWLTELKLALPVERFAERNALRRSLINVRQAQRNLLDQTEGVRVEVRRIVNNIRLQERLVEIQRRSVEVAERQREFAQLQFEDGKIDNRDKVLAEQQLLSAQNALNRAKTNRWTLLLQFRLATETLRVDEDGHQHASPDMP